MDILLYQKRVLALEKEFTKVRRQLGRLRNHVRYHPDEFSKEAVKCQLDSLRLLIRAIKDETAFYLKLGQNYDILNIVYCICDSISRRDPQLFEEIINEVNEKFQNWSDVDYSLIDKK
ncbi:MAG: hypothetical protein NTY09_14075 [bacterium]|nr:hypothetical protein [bacterium]